MSFERLCNRGARLQSETGIKTLWMTKSLEHDIYTYILGYNRDLHLIIKKLIKKKGTKIAISEKIIKDIG